MTLSTRPTAFGRVLRTGLSSLWDRAASRLAALRFNPSRRAKWVALGVFFLATFVAAAVQGHPLAATLYLVLGAVAFYRIESEA